MNREQNIQSITEAFSMQPQSLYVGQRIPKEGVLTKDQKKIAEIKEESIQISQSECCLYVCGYDEEGNRVFKYIAKSVNIHYQS